MDRKDTYMIDLVGLQDGVTEFDYKIGGGFFDAEDSGRVLGADVDVHLTVNKRHESYRLDFSFDGELRAACDRCLDAVRLELAEDYAVVVRHGEDYDMVETGDGEDLMIIPESDTKLDVAPIIRDTLLLSIPMRCVHPEGECNAEMASRLRDME